MMRSVAMGTGKSTDTHPCSWRQCREASERGAARAGQVGRVAASRLAAAAPATVPPPVHAWSVGQEHGAAAAVSQRAIAELSGGKRLASDCKARQGLELQEPTRQGIAHGDAATHPYKPVQAQQLERGDGLHDGQLLAGSRGLPVVCKFRMQHVVFTSSQGAEL